MPVRTESDGITRPRGHSQELSSGNVFIWKAKRIRKNHGNFGDIMIVVSAIVVTFLIMGVALVSAQPDYPKWEPILGTDEPEASPRLQQSEVQVNSRNN